MLQTTINTRKISLGSALSEYSGETGLDIGTASLYSSTIISDGVQADALAATRSGVTPIPPTGSPRLSLNPKNSEKLVHGHLRALRHGEMAWSVRLLHVLHWPKRLLALLPMLCTLTGCVMTVELDNLNVVFDLTEDLTHQYRIIELQNLLNAIQYVVEDVNELQLSRQADLNAIINYFREVLGNKIYLCRRQFVYRKI